MPRNMPQCHFTLTNAIKEYIDAEVDRRGVSASEIVRSDIDFAMRYRNHPEIMSRFIAYMDEQERTIAKPRREGVEKAKKIAA